MTPPSSDGTPRRYIGNLLIPLVTLGIIVAYFIETLEYPEQEDVGPAGVPYLWMAFTAIFCTALAFRAVQRRGTADPASGRIGTVWLAAAWLVAYLVTIQWAGYFVSTFFFLIGSMVGLGYRNIPVIALVTVGWLVFCYLVFFRLLFIPLPVGPLLSPLIG